MDEYGLQLRANFTASPFTLAVGDTSQEPGDEQTGDTELRGTPSHGVWGLQIPQDEPEQDCGSEHCQTHDGRPRSLHNQVVFKEAIKSREQRKRGCCAIVKCWSYPAGLLVSIENVEIRHFKGSTVSSPDEVAHPNEGQV